MQTEVIDRHKIPTFEECLANLNRHGSGLVDGVNCLGKDSHAQKNKANKKKFKELEEKAIRTFYDQTDVKRAARLEDNMFTQEEKNGVIGGVGALYMCGFLLQKIMVGNFGALLTESSRGAAAVYTHCINHIELVADLLMAFTDRFNYNVKECGELEFGIDLNVNELCTDIDVLAIDNVIKAFSARFVKSINKQEEYIRQKMEEKKLAEMGRELVEKAEAKKAKAEAKRKAKKGVTK